MKLDQLRKIIREEVRDAVKSELQEVMNEAIKIASTPNVQKITESKPIKVEKKVPQFNTGKASLDEMLQMTKKSMTNEEYKNVFTGTSDMVTGMPNTATSMVSQMGMSAGRQPGIDLNNLDFVKKAGKIFKASNEIDAAKKV